MRAIHLYCDLFAGAVLDGLQAELAASGIDIGARAQLAQEALANGADDDEAMPEPTMADAVELDEGAEAAANEIEGEATEASA